MWVIQIQRREPLMQRVNNHTITVSHNTHIHFCFKMHNFISDVWIFSFSVLVQHFTQTTELKCYTFGFIASSVHKTPPYDNSGALKRLVWRCYLHPRLWNVFESFALLNTDQVRPIEFICFRLVDISFWIFVDDYNISKQTDSFNQFFF